MKNTMRADFFWKTQNRIPGRGRECEFTCVVPVDATVAEMLTIAGRLAPVRLDARHGPHGVYQVQTDLGIFTAPTGVDVRSPRTTFSTWDELEAAEGR
jgi:hypothetical protein